MTIESTPSREQLATDDLVTLYFPHLTSVWVFEIDRATDGLWPKMVIFRPGEIILDGPFPTPSSSLLEINDVDIRVREILKEAEPNRQIAHSQAFYIPRVSMLETDDECKALMEVLSTKVDQQSLQAHLEELQGETRGLVRGFLKASFGRN